METFLETRALSKDFELDDQWWWSSGEKIKALKGVSLKIVRGETLGLVGESGCGKSTLGRCVARLVKPSSGQIFFDGRDISQLRGKDLLGIRKRIQIIFQDPYGSLNPRMTVGEILSEGMQIHGLGRDRHEWKTRVLRLLDRVGLRNDSFHRMPHEFSGGQRQRIGIARALSVEPEFIVCDEAVSALDVSIQAQILNLLMDLQKELQLTYLFISHDLSVIRHVSDRIVVMYLGSVVETGLAQEVFESPMHPYTEALLSAIPRVGTAPRKRIRLTGELPSASAKISGCTFRTRCPIAQDRCRTSDPLLQEHGKGHQVACHFAKLELNK